MDYLGERDPLEPFESVTFEDGETPQKKIQMDEGAVVDSAERIASVSRRKTRVTQLLGPGRAPPRVPLRRPGSHRPRGGRDLSRGRTLGNDGRQDYAFLSRRPRSSPTKGLEQPLHKRRQAQTTSAPTYHQTTPRRHPGPPENLGKGPRPSPALTSRWQGTQGRPPGRLHLRASLPLINLFYRYY